MSSDAIVGDIVGDAEQIVQTDFIPVLSGMGEDKLVVVYNPMPRQFRVVFSRSGTAPAEKDPGAKLMQERTGLDVSKTANPLRHETQSIILEPEAVRNLPGDIAQIAVRKLTNYIIQTRNDDGSWDFSGHGGNKQFVPDPQRRQQIEQEIVKSIKNTMDMFNQPTPTTSETLAKLNPEVKDEPTDPVPNPAPGTGVSYTPKTKLPSGPGKPGETQPGASKNPA